MSFPIPLFHGSLHKQTVCLHNKKNTQKQYFTNSLYALVISCHHSVISIIYRTMKNMLSETYSVSMLLSKTAQ